MCVPLSLSLSLARSFVRSEIPQGRVNTGKAIEYAKSLELVRALEKPLTLTFETLRDKKPRKKRRKRRRAASESEASNSSDSARRRRKSKKKSKRKAASRRDRDAELTSGA